MKKNFITGLLVGVLSALLLVSGVGAAFLLADFNNVKTTEAKESISSEEISSQSLTADNYEEIQAKLKFLDKLIDNYYLEDTKDVEFTDGIYKGFIASLGDPYSTYYTAEEYKAMTEGSSGVYFGIGASVSQDTKTGIITIVKPFKDGPAYKAGMLPGDILYKVNGKEVTGEDLTQVVTKLKGASGTTVKVSVLRDNKEEPINFTITRKKIEVPTIEYKMLDNKIGYITITEFDAVTVDQFKSAVDTLEKKGMKGLVVDVRNNPGGLLDSVVKILDRLLPKELLVYTEDKNNVREEEHAVDNTKVTVPMAVLINGNSASASEIFAGALQDYKAATIIGTTSFGKGIVQKVIPISDGTAVKLTIYKYYTPKGRNIHGKGITPDITLDLTEAMKKEVTIPIEKDNQLQRAIKELKKKIK
jgi:carboxyl-terminal processing protease